MDKINAVGKKVLLFCPSFFGYDLRIADALRECGCEVDLHNEKPGNRFIDKASVRLNIGLYRPVIKKYIQSVIDSHRDKQYDYVLVVKGEAITREAVSLMRKAYPNAKFVLYLWDSVENIPECDSRMRKYDRILTFDPQDAKDYNLLLRPLFFGKEYGQAAGQQSYEYDFAFVGTAHSIRPRVVGQLARERAEKGRKSFSYLFLPHPLVYLNNKLRNPCFRSVRMSDIHFKPMSAEEIRDVYGRSKCILDVEHDAQRGLTMRTIELVGMQKKMITTNVQVRDYDFYNPRNIYVIDRDHPAVDEDFWDTPYEPIPEHILSRYSITSFVQEILDM